MSYLPSTSLQLPLPPPHTKKKRSTNKQTKTKLHTHFLEVPKTHPLTSRYESDDIGKKSAFIIGHTDDVRFVKNTIGPQVVFIHKQRLRLLFFNKK